MKDYCKINVLKAGVSDILFHYIANKPPTKGSIITKKGAHKVVAVIQKLNGSWNCYVE